MVARRVSGGQAVGKVSRVRPIRSGFSSSPPPRCRRTLVLSCCLVFSSRRLRPELLFGESLVVWSSLPSAHLWLSLASQQNSSRPLSDFSGQLQERQEERQKAKKTAHCFSSYFTLHQSTAFSVFGHLTRHFPTGDVTCDNRPAVVKVYSLRFP